MFIHNVAQSLDTDNVLINFTDTVLTFIDYSKGMYCLLPALAHCLTSCRHAYTYSLIKLSKLLNAGPSGRAV